LAAFGRAGPAVPAERHDHRAGQFDVVKDGQTAGRPAHDIPAVASCSIAIVHIAGGLIPAE
jgi:hypothetical protein